MVNGFYVYAKRPGQPSRPLAGPVAKLEDAQLLVGRATEVALAWRYISPHSDVVYAGPVGPSSAGRDGLLNHLLGLPTHPAGATVEA